MLPVQIVAILLAVVWGGMGLIWLGLGFFWLRRIMTPRRREEARAEEEEQAKRKGSRSTAWKAYGVVNKVVVYGLPTVLVIDGLIFRIGLLYAPQLSIFTSFDLYFQTAGLVISFVGLATMWAAGKILAVEVYAKATEERKMITRGIYAYVRHPFYLHGILIPVGLVLLTLNYLALLLVVFYTEPWSVMKWVREEEQELLKRYGKEYDDYMKKTGMFLPRIRK